MTRGPRTLLALLSLCSLAVVACGSPWPPAGGERPGARGERPYAPFPPDDRESLLDYADANAISLTDRTVELPGQSQAVCAAALKRGANDDLEGLLSLMAPNAYFGLVPASDLPPAQRDPRRFEPLEVARHPELFMQRLRDAGHAMSTQSASGTTRIACGREFPSVQHFVSLGAEPMWCSYKDSATRAWINFTLITTAEGPRISYVATSAPPTRRFPGYDVWPPHSTTISMTPATRPRGRSPF